MDWQEVFPQLYRQHIFIQHPWPEVITGDEDLQYLPSQIAPGFNDWDAVPEYRVRVQQSYGLTERDNARLQIALADASRNHDTHGNAWHPLCRTCVALRLVHGRFMVNATWKDVEYSSGADAIENAQLWIARYGNKPFPPPDCSGVTYEETRNQYLTRDQLDDLPRPDPIIEGILSRHSYALLVGRDSTFKTFIALDWALCVATGKPWQGRTVEKLPVLFIAGEGAYGLAQRVDAWEYAWGEKVQPEQFMVRQSAVNLFRGGHPLKELLQVIEDNSIGLVIVDTLAKASAGGNLASSDAGVILENLERIKRATFNGTVLTIAHTQKSDMDTSGLHQIEDDSDTVWHAAVDDAVITVTNRKQKDAPTTAPLRLETQPVLESLVLQSASGPKLKPATDAQQAILETLHEAFSELGATKQELMLASGVPRSTFYRALNSLLKSGNVTGDDSKTTRFRAVSHPVGLESLTPSHTPEGGNRE